MEGRVQIWIKISVDSNNSREHDIPEGIVTATSQSGRCGERAAKIPPICEVSNRARHGAR